MRYWIRQFQKEQQQVAEWNVEFDKPVVAWAWDVLHNQWLQWRNKVPLKRRGMWPTIVPGSEGFQYLPIKNQIEVPNSAYTSTSVADFAAMAHEIGHSMQNRTLLIAVGYMVNPIVLAVVCALCWTWCYYFFSLQVFFMPFLILMLGRIMIYFIEKDASKKALKIIGQFASHLDQQAVARILDEALESYIPLHLK